MANEINPGEGISLNDLRETFEDKSSIQRIVVDEIHNHDDLISDVKFYPSTKTDRDEAEYETSKPKARHHMMGEGRVASGRSSQVKSTTPCEAYAMLRILEDRYLRHKRAGTAENYLRKEVRSQLASLGELMTMDILYGSRSADDLVQLKEIQDVWMKTKDVDVFLTIDRPQEGWDGNVGFVPNYLRELAFDTNRIAVLCGPPIMIKFCLQALQEMGFKKDQIWTTLELRMKCGVGKCGRCNIGSKYVCKDGPVFRCDQIDELPAEY